MEYETPPIDSLPMDEDDDDDDDDEVNLLLLLICTLNINTDIVQTYVFISVVLISR
jgi:hypothetical protein